METFSRFSNTIVSMNIESLREYCITIKGATECFPFDDENLVFKVLGKMFALIPLNPNESEFYTCVKCDPEYAIELREKYEGIAPAYHFNKKYWNMIYLDSDVPESLIKELIDHSVQEVLKKLPKRVQTEYLSNYSSPGGYITKV